MNCPTIRNRDPRPIKLIRCGCGALIPRWRDFCWRHLVEMTKGWPET
jgi:hypothetical protein